MVGDGERERERDCLFDTLCISRMKQWTLLIVSLTALDGNPSRAFTTPCFSPLQLEQQQQQQQQQQRQCFHHGHFAKEPQGNDRMKYKRRPGKTRKHQRGGGGSPEYQRILDSLLATKKNNTVSPVIELSSLIPKEQAMLIRDLARHGAYHTIQRLVLSLQQQQQQQQHAPHQLLLREAAIAALCRSRSQDDRATALDLVIRRVDGDQNLSLSVQTCIVLFQQIKETSIAVNLLQRLSPVHSIEVWNAAMAVFSRDDARQGGWQSALATVRDMRKVVGIQPDERTYVYLLRACANAGQVRIALEVLLTEIPMEISARNNPHVWGAALHACAQGSGGGGAAHVRDALVILNTMQARHVDINTIHVSALLSTMARAGKDHECLAILHAFHNKASVQVAPNVTLQPVPLDLVAINTVLSACSKTGNYQDAREILHQLKRGEYPDIVAPDVISYNTVLSACSDPEEAKLLVKEMQLSRRHRYGIVTPTAITYTNAIRACRNTGNVDTARFFLECARNDGIQPNVYMYSAAIWTCRENGDAALEILQHMRAEAIVVPNIISYNGVLSALASQSRAEEALSLFEEIIDEKLRPNPITFQLLAAAIRSSTQDIAKSEMLEHVLTLMGPGEMRVGIGGPILEALIRQYGAGGKYVEARRVFEQIRGPVGAYCLRAMLYACSAGEPPRWEDALSLLHTSDIVEGTRGPGKVDTKALSYAILACAKANQWEEALNLAELYGRAYSPHPMNDTTDSAVSLPGFNSLIAACGRCGQPGVALRVLNDMEIVFGVAPNEQTYRIAIIACNQAEHNQRRRQRRGLERNNDDTTTFQWWECALSLLRQMKERGLSVDPQTHSSVISSCEAAGQWQRALGVLHSMLKSKQQPGATDYSRLNLYCFNAAISACEKGGAWVEALELYYRMLDKGGPVTPNFVTVSSLLVALDKAGQKELAQSTYEDAVQNGVVTPWKMTRGNGSTLIRAMDLHRFSAAMTNAAVRSVMESLLDSTPIHDITQNLVIIVGKGKGSEDKPVLLPTVQSLLQQEYGVPGQLDPTNAGRVIISSEALRSFVKTKQWRS